MSPKPEPTAPAAVSTLRRPPVRKATTVRSDVGHTFDTFVRTIGVWWPTETFSAGRERVQDVTLERRAGGRVYETWNDGTAVEWGEVKVWDPPNRFSMSWFGTPAETEVELSFQELGPSVTRVTVEHRGWEALSESQLAEDCALPGGYRSGAYALGWQRILDAFTSRFDGENAG